MPSSPVRGERAEERALAADLDRGVIRPRRGSPQAARGGGLGGRGGAPAGGDQER